MKVKRYEATHCSPEQMSTANNINDHQANYVDDSCKKFRGVRKRKWGKWVSEIRVPNSRERIWLGSYDSVQKAARAFDVAQYCLRGPHANFNFPNILPAIDGAQSLNYQQIQGAAAKYANEYDHQESCDGSSSSVSDHGAHHVRVDDHDNGGSSTIDWSFYDMLDSYGSASDFGLYYGLDNMTTHHELYNPPSATDQVAPVDDNPDDDKNNNGGEGFPQRSFLWNFDA